MNADRWQTIEKILHDARELNGNDRVFQSRFSETFGDWQRQGQDLFDKGDTSHATEADQCDALSRALFSAV